jgi:hypothetical protein
MNRSRRRLLLLAMAANGGGSAPSSEFRFDGRALPSSLTFTRASGATRINQRGYLEEVAADVLRYSYDPGLPYNLAVNPWGDGTTYPDEWGNVGAGLTAAMSGRTTNSDGTVTVEITVSGTSNGNATNLFFTEGTGLPISVPCSPGDVFSLDVGFELVSVSGADVRLWLNSVNSSGTIINSNSVQTSLVTAGAPAARYRVSGALVNASTAGAAGSVRIEGTTGGVAVAAVFRVTFPVLNTGASYLADTVPLATLAQRVGTTPQYGLLGALIERISATNGIRNPRWEGAVAGSPGTMATNMTITSDNGLTRTIVGAGVESGRPYLEIRWAGVTAGAAMLFFTDGASSISAVAGDLRNASAEARIVAGSATGVSGFRSVLFFLDGGGAVLATHADTTRTLSSAMATSVAVSTAAPALTAFARQRIDVQTSVGAAVDVTVRFYRTQLESGSFASSLILPPVGTPGAQLRAADIANGDATLIDLDKSSIAIVFRVERGGVGVAATGVESHLSIVDADGSDQLLVNTNTAVFPRLLARRAAGATTQVQLSAVGSGAFQTVAAAWDAGATDGAFNGVTPSNSGVSPAGTAAAIQIGASGFSLTPSNQTIKRLSIWKGVRLTAAQVQAQSARTT